MSSYPPSTSAVNQSTESYSSSLQRSGLNISVGDTKSIVLALQALQQKIRVLEQDRDYHQDQYERALQAHETFKIDMERRMEQERTTHRTRETELQAQLKRTSEEKTRLEDAMGNNNRSELVEFREEIEGMIAQEKRVSQQREGQLLDEVERLRGDIHEEKAKHAALLVSLDRAQAERDATSATNEQLRLALDDLLSRQERQEGHPEGLSGAAAQRQRRMSSATRRNGVQRASRQELQQRRHSSPAFGSRTSGDSRVVSPAGGSRYTYRDPTCNSLLRDVRNVSGEMPCCNHEPTDMVLAVPPPASSTSPRRPITAEHSFTSARNNSNSPQRRQDNGNSRNNSAMRSNTRPAPVVAVAPASASSAASMPSGKHQQKTPRSAVDAVERQLLEEMNDLQSQYRDTIARAAVEDIPRDILNAALTRISALIDHKVEQLKLMKDARRELDTATGGAASSAAAALGREYGCSDANMDKAVQRAMLVNELRAMLAESEGK